MGSLVIIIISKTVNKLVYQKIRNFNQIRDIYKLKKILKQAGVVHDINSQ